MFILLKRARTNVEVSPWRGVNVEEMQCLFDGVQELLKTFVKLKKKLEIANLTNVMNHGLHNGGNPGNCWMLSRH